MNRCTITIALLCPLLSLQADILNGFHQQKLILERDINILQKTMMNIDEQGDIKALKKLRKEYTIVNKK